MSVTVIPFEAGEAQLDWLALTEALAAGHLLPKAEIADTFLYRDPDTLLNRAAWINGLGSAVKTATIFPGNTGTATPSINGGVMLFSDDDGTLQAIIDFHLVTKWKTAGDSLLAARRLARPDSKNILIVGAGTQAQGLHSAYSAAFPQASFTIWNRTGRTAQALAAKVPNLRAMDDLETAVRDADIIICATMSTQPLIRGDWLQPGQHIDLIGAYRPDMREVDNTAMTRARVFVDSLDTTVGHIGEIKIPIETGVIKATDIVAEYYTPEDFKRGGDDEITLFKNGGGAHLDLMTSRYILNQWNAKP
ncbi:MAG: ornithine cyclodeaminase [Paracoccaceae bacterium]|nr:ornithine cyclodeaminase [Paracoccaceae bacterium]